MARISAEGLWISFAIFDYQHVSVKHMALRLGRRTPAPVVHALRGISFEAADGDRIGLIGHNGSGKSTLLRALAGVYQPTEGRLETEGRRGSLFNLAAGLDAEATGFENITLLGVSAGMTRRQVEAHRDEIIAFTDLGDALQRPVRTYSAGMQLRLAFGVATAMPADILLIDEVIGAGDASFQNRAKARIEALMGQAKILLMASHADSVLKDNCNRGLVFHQGGIAFDGPIEEAIAFANPQPALPRPAMPQPAPARPVVRRPRPSTARSATLFPNR